VLALFSHKQTLPHRLFSRFLGDVIHLETIANQWLHMYSQKNYCNATHVTIFFPNTFDSRSPANRETFVDLSIVKDNTAQE
jgi:hypothetical protein